LNGQEDPRRHDVPPMPLVAAQPADGSDGLWPRLKSGTRAVHEGLDSRIMSARPFENLDRYGVFALVQHDFHVLVSPLYQNVELGRLLPDLASRDRLARIEQDLRDLNIAVPERAGRSDYLLDVPTALGWLYVAEGSNLGAAFLSKAAEKIGLSENFGARHLAGAPEGRARHWKAFTTALDALDLGAEQEAAVISGANDAFAKVRSFVERRFFAAQLA
jgi:heme oxygenase